MMVSNRTLLFQGSIFRGYVSFREGNPRKRKINLEMEERPFLYISYHLFFRASVYFFQGMSWPDLEILIIPKPLRGKISKQLFWLCLCQQSWVIDWSFGRSWIWVVLKASGDKDLEPPTKNGWMDGWMDEDHEDFLIENLSKLNLTSLCLSPLELQVSKVDGGFSISWLFSSKSSKTIGLVW